MKISGKRYVTGELLVRTQGDPAEVADRYGAKVLERFDFSGTRLESQEGELVRLKLSEGAELSHTLEALGEDPSVVYAEPNQVITLPATTVQATSLPGDLGEELWGLHNTGQSGGTPGADISALEAWQTSRGTDGPLIAVVDTGVDYNHPDLQANIWTNPGEIPGNGIDDDGNGVVDDIHGYSALDDNGDPFDGNRHGTHVAGTIAAVGDNGQGITGVMQRAQLMPIKIFSAEGRTSSDVIVRGLLYAAKMGVDITNNSWGARPSEAIKEAFASHDALHVMAAGNRNQDNDSSPAFPSNLDLDNLVVVAASDRNDQKANYSNYGVKNVDVTAPGSDIWSTFPGGGYTSMSGTSMAAPHVTGTAGLIASAYPTLSTQELKQRLIFGSDPVPDLEAVSLSGGRLNAAAAIEDDTVAPGAPDEFRAGSANSRGVGLSWLGAADDGSSGESVAVEVRVSDSPISEQNFAAAPLYGYGRSQVTFETAPDTVAQKLYFGAQAVDNVGNRSQVSTASATLPAAELSFRDDFEEPQSTFVPSGNFHLVEDSERGKLYVAQPRQERAPESTLTSAPITLSKGTNSYLRFEVKTDLYWESSARVEVSEDGKRWSRLLELDKARDWSVQGADLSEYDGKSVQVRFKVNSRWGEPRQDLALNRVEILNEVPVN